MGPGRSLERLDDKETGEVHESYTMFTLSANAHPLMSRMPRPVVDPVSEADYWARDSGQEFVIEAVMALRRL